MSIKSMLAVGVIAIGLWIYFTQPDISAWLHDKLANPGT